MGTAVGADLSAREATTVVTQGQSNVPPLVGADLSARAASLRFRSIKSETNPANLYLTCGPREQGILCCPIVFRVRGTLLFP